MKRKWISSIIIVILFVNIFSFMISCKGTSPKIELPDSEYPADIVGQVIVANKVENWFMDEPGTLKLKDGYVFWVVTISVRNKTYKESIPNQRSPWGYWGWGVEIAGKIYHPPEAFKVLSSEIKLITQGETTKFINCFEVPISLSIKKAKLLYMGQEPYSYGELLGGDIVASYDWYLKKEMTSNVSKNKVATVDRIWVSYAGSRLYVDLKPTSYAIANKVYTVELYEKGKLRQTTKVSWIQPEINVSTMRHVEFSVTRQEAEAYGMEGDLSNIFSANIHD